MKQHSRSHSSLSRTPGDPSQLLAAGVLSQTAVGSLQTLMAGVARQRQRTQVQTLMAGVALQQGQTQVQTLIAGVASRRQRRMQGQIPLLLHLMLNQRQLQPLSRLRRPGPAAVISTAGGVVVAGRVGTGAAGAGGPQVVAGLVVGRASRVQMVQRGRIAIPELAVAGAGAGDVAVSTAALGTSLHQTSSSGCPGAPAAARAALLPQRRRMQQRQRRLLWV